MNILQQHIIFTYMYVLKYLKVLLSFKFITKVSLRSVVFIPAFVERKIFVTQTGTFFRTTLYKTR